MRGGGCWGNCQFSCSLRAVAALVRKGVGPANPQCLNSRGLQRTVNCRDRPLHAAGIVERHHIPGWATGLQNSYSRGMAIEMDWAADLETSSWGSGAAAYLYRDLIANI